MICSYIQGRPDAGPSDGHHSISVANNARFIAEKVEGMDCDKAYVMENSYVNLV